MMKILRCVLITVDSINDIMVAIINNQIKEKNLKVTGNQNYKFSMPN